MPKCRDCRWARVNLGDPTKGICIYGRSEASGEETSSGIQQAVLPGKNITLRDEACEHFEPKPSKQQVLKEGM